MYQPEAYIIALIFMIGSMLCWGSWANTMKLTPGWPFQLFYWDYVAGIIIASLLWGLTLGSMGGGQLSFLNNIRTADRSHILFALLGGAVFNVANLLLVAAIEIAGLAVAFPIGIGLALVVGVLLNYIISPQGNPLLLFGGVLFVALAIIIPLLHIALFVAIVVAAAIFLMAVWKAMFGTKTTTSPPAPVEPPRLETRS